MIKICWCLSLNRHLVFAPISFVQLSKTTEFFFFCLSKSGGNVTVCLQVLNFLPWFLVFCSSLWLPLWGGEKALMSMASLPLASLVLEPSLWTVKAPVIFYQLGPPLTLGPGSWGAWASGSVATGWTSLPDFGAPDCPLCTQRVSFRAFSGCLLGSLLCEWNSHWV